MKYLKYESFIFLSDLMVMAGIKKISKVVVKAT